MNCSNCKAEWKPPAGRSIKHYPFCGEAIFAATLAGKEAAFLVVSDLTLSISEKAELHSRIGFNLKQNHNISKQRGLYQDKSEDNVPEKAAPEEFRGWMEIIKKHIQFKSEQS